MATTTKRAFEDMSKDELIKELVKRDAMIVKLNKKAKTTDNAENVDPAKVKAVAERLKTMARQQIKKQMKWKPSCKRGSARFSWSSMCDEPTFRAFMGLGPQDKLKGGKLSVEEFSNLIGGEIVASIRYDYLRINSKTVNITYNKNDNELKINGGYGIN